MTMAEMTPADLNTLAAAVGKMTPGPWHGDRLDGSVKYAVLGADDVAVIKGDNGNANPYDNTYYGVQTAADEVGIVALVNAAPALLALARVGLGAERRKS